MRFLHSLMAIMVLISILLATRPKVAIFLSISSDLGGESYIFRIESARRATLMVTLC